MSVGPIFTQKGRCPPGNFPVFSPLLYYVRRTDYVTFRCVLIIAPYDLVWEAPGLGVGAQRRP